MTILRSPFRAAALVALLATPALAEDHALTLDEALTRALARNYTIAIERDAYAASDHVVRRESGAYDVSFESTGAFAKRTDPVNSLLSGAPAGAVAPELTSFDFDATLTRLLPTGGTLSLVASGGRLRSDDSFSLLAPSYSTSLGLELRQPLLRDRAIDPVRARIRVARREHERSLAGLKRTVADTLAAVDAAYWNLAAAQRALDVRGEAVALAERQLGETRARIQAGTLPDNEEAQPRAELERRKGERLAAQEEATRAENTLKALVLDDGADPLWSSRLVPGDAAETGADAVDVAAALAAAEARPEIEEARAALAARMVERRVADDETRPRLDAFASYARRGLAGRLNPNAQAVFGVALAVPPALDGALGRSLGTIGDGLYPDVRVGLSLALPIGNRGAQASAALGAVAERQAQAALARARQAVRVEVLNAAAAAETTAERIGAARAARDAAEVQFRSEHDRFDVGMSTNFLVLTRQNDLSRARLDEIQALADHRKALTELARASGRLLEDRHVVATDAPTGAEGGVK